MTRHFAFLFIGGPHHFMHMAPVAASLSRRENVRVTAYVSDQESAAELQTMLNQLGANSIDIKPLSISSWFDTLGNIIPKWKSWKLVRLLWWCKDIVSADAIVTAERTSTILKKLPGTTPPFYHIPHGAGDRAKGFEKRISLFDHVLVAGPKDRDRMIAEGLLPANQISVTGSVKLAGLRRLQKGKPKLFGNDRPVVLYNPHFDQSLASFDREARNVIDRLGDDERYNLIVAPHIRLFEEASETQKAEWQKLARPDQILIDLGSERSSDMTYTLGADIYLGDVSSQIYEFISNPRPAIFFNSHKVAWEGDENYRMWQLGDVVESSDDLIAALDRTAERHRHYRPLQEEAALRALGDPNRDGGEVAADILVSLLRART